MNPFQIVALFFLGAIASAKFPLLVYATTLAIFGIPHVVREYRYLRPRIEETGASSLVYGLVGGIVFLRAISLLFPARLPFGLELGLGFVALGLIAIWAGRLGILACVAFGIAALGLYAPTAVFLVFAFAHNLIAFGVLATARKIPRALWFGLGLVPIVFWLGGIPAAFDRGLGGATAETLFAAYLPTSLWFEELGYRLFSVAAYLQILHYVCILGYLPVPALDFRKAVLNPYALLVAAAFFVNFAATRSLYSLPAGFHAWLELPLVALILIPGKSRPEPSRPRIPRSGALS